MSSAVGKLPSRTHAYASHGPRVRGVALAPSRFEWGSIKIESGPLRLPQKGLCPLRSLKIWFVHSRRGQHQNAE